MNRSSGRLPAALRPAKLALLAPLAMGLSACVSLGSEPPESLLTLSSTATASEATTSAAGAEGAIAVLIPEVPAKLDVLRVPVKVSDTEIAYLQEAFWVEKPARLFRQLIGESLRMQTGVLVLDTEDTPLNAPRALRGTLREFGYDATRSAVVVQFDAIRSTDGGAEDSKFETRRFEAVETGVLAEPSDVGQALNRAANQVAAEVTVWMTEG